MGADNRFELIDVARVFSGRHVIVDRQRWRAPDGADFEREVVQHPGSVAVLPVLDGDVILLRLFRAPVGKEVLEIPAGVRDVETEDPETTAVRECEEEIGYRPRSMTRLAGFHSSPGYTTELTHLYLGEGLERVPPRPDSAEEHAAEVVRLQFGEALRRVEANEIDDAKTMLAIFAAAALRPDLAH